MIGLRSRTAASALQILARPPRSCRQNCSRGRASAAIKAGSGLGPCHVDLVEEVADEGFGSLVRLHPGGRGDVHRRARRRRRRRRTRARRRTASPTRDGLVVAGGVRLRLAPREHAHRHDQPRQPPPPQPADLTRPDGIQIVRRSMRPFPAAPRRPRTENASQNPRFRHSSYPQGATVTLNHSSPGIPNTTRHAPDGRLSPCTSQRRASPSGCACCAGTPAATCPPTSWPACSSPRWPSPSPSGTPWSRGCRCRSASTPCRRPCSPTRCSAPRGCCSSGRSRRSRCCPARSCAPCRAATPQLAVQLTSVLAITAGVVLVAVGLLRLGWVAQFLSEPIVTGFVAGPGRAHRRRRDPRPGRPARRPPAASSSGSPCWSRDSGDFHGLTLVVGAHLARGPLRRLAPGAPGAVVAHRARRRHRRRRPSSTSPPRASASSARCPPASRSRPSRSSTSRCGAASSPAAWPSPPSASPRGWPPCAPSRPAVPWTPTPTTRSSWRTAPPTSPPGSSAGWGSAGHCRRPPPTRGPAPTPR